MGEEWGEGAGGWLCRPFKLRVLLVIKVEAHGGSMSWLWFEGRIRVPWKVGSERWECNIKGYISHASGGGHRRV